MCNQAGAHPAHRWAPRACRAHDAARALYARVERKKRKQTKTKKASARRGARATPRRRGSARGEGDAVGATPTRPSARQSHDDWNYGSARIALRSGPRGFRRSQRTGLHALRPRREAADGAGAARPVRLLRACTTRAAAAMPRALRARTARGVRLCTRAARAPGAMASAHLHGRTRRAERALQR